MGKDKNRLFWKLRIYLLAFFLFPLFVLLAVSFFYLDIPYKKFLFIFLITVLTAGVSFFVFNLVFCSYFTLPYSKISSALDRFFKENYFSEPIKSEGSFEIKKLISQVNRVILELQAYRAFKINSIVDENNKAKTLVDIIPDMALLMDDKNELMYSNEKAKLLLDIDFSMRSPIFPACIKNKSFSSRIEELMLSEKDFNVAEISVDSAKAGIKVYIAILKRFKMTAMKKNGTALVIRDITTEKQFEAAKDDFFHMITHDMRAPLSTIEGYLAMVRKKLQDKNEPEFEKYFSKIFYSSSKLKGMIEDILNYKKLKERKAVLNIERIPVKELIQKTIDEHSPAAILREISMEFEISAETDSFLGDFFLLQRALSNFISNAIKFTPAKGKIKISFFEEKDFYVFKVSDTGAGIPKEKKDIIFEKYYTYSNGKNEGFGLGLALCKLVAQAHNGKVWVESFVGEGSSFYLSVLKNNV